MTVRIGAAEVDRVEEQQFPDPSLAAASRRALVARLHGERAYLFPAHFAAPHYGLVERDGDEYVFVPVTRSIPGGSARGPARGRAEGRARRRDMPS